MLSLPIHIIKTILFSKGKAEMFQRNLFQKWRVDRGGGVDGNFPCPLGEKGRSQVSHCEGRLDSETTRRTTWPGKGTNWKKGCKGALD